MDHGWSLVIVCCCHGNTTTAVAQSRRGGVGTGITGKTGLLGRGGRMSGEMCAILW